MNVLSLFDGMSCGQIALNRAGFKDFVYYASEIDKQAITVTMANYPKTIQLGDVMAIKAEQLPYIDLLIGGSPCQGFSCAGKGSSFDHPESRLFFEFVRILRECKPKYFLLENVRMKKEWRDIISQQLGCEPIYFDSAAVTAGHRKRLYWTNIPAVSPLVSKNIVLRDIWDMTIDRENIYSRMLKKVPGTLAFKNTWRNVRTLHQKANCITARTPSITNTGATNVKLGNEFYTKLSVIEYERLQTVPDGYTAHVGNPARYRMLGNGWTVDVIAHIFKCIKGE